ncbi:MAG: epoxyqueuosine reductase QueH [Thermoplasmata archaeon]
MKLLIHACCAPCLTYTYESFRAEDVTVYWFNPNIHPFKEHERRMDSMKKFARAKGIDVVYAGEYSLLEFLKGAIKADNRCRFCYEWRLEAAAKYASENYFDAFTTTLSISPYQDHGLIKDLGDKLSKKYGARFIYKDMRDGFRKSQTMAREHGLYMQKYCGCIFSEEERYRN